MPDNQNFSEASGYLGKSIEKDLVTAPFLAAGLGSVYGIFRSLTPFELNKKPNVPAAIGFGLLATVSTTLGYVLKQKYEIELNQIEARQKERHVEALVKNRGIDPSAAASVASNFMENSDWLTRMRGRDQEITDSMKAKKR